MLTIKTALEPRLQKRYEKLVTEHLSVKHTIAAGLSCLPAKGSAFASTQAAWRFFQNQRVTIAALLNPLLACAKQAVAKQCREYALLVHDLTDLNYKNHTRKLERIKLNKGLCGYQLQSSLLLSDVSGDPLAPVSQSLWTEKGLYTTRFEDRIEDAAALDELSKVIQESASWQWNKPVVHIHDRGADSVGHYRQWISLQALFLVRADAKPSVVWQQQSCSLGEIVSQLAFRFSRKVKIKGVTAKQYIAESEVEITRPAYPHRQRKGVVEGRKRIAGEAIKLRLVVSEIRDEKGKVLSQWLLYTNLPKSVKAKQIALWYYYRWEIESYFKLLKSAGQNLENWQQESPQALMKRLLVASMACVVVWQLGKAEGEDAKQARALLIRLSGRQMKWGVEFTDAALLAGLWSLLTMLEVLGDYEIAQLKQMAQTILPNFERFKET